MVALYMANPSIISSQMLTPMSERNKPSHEGQRSFSYEYTNPRPNPGPKSQMMLSTLAKSFNLNPLQ